MQAKKTHSISVAVATYNEEDSISRCLKSVQGWVDEIVVVDGGSTDNTQKEIMSHGGRVIPANNPPMFHINKQKAIEACTCEWILQLDADEEVTAALREEILHVIQSSSFVGYWVPRKNYFLGTFLKKGGQYPDYTLRLYKNGKARLPCKSVHEQAVVDGNTSYLSSDLLHYSYPNFDHYLEHFNRYTSILAKEYRDSKISTGMSSHVSYLFGKPIGWFLWTYIRHKGFQDGLAGFVFSFFSSLRFFVAYIKYLEVKKHHES